MRTAVPSDQPARDMAARRFDVNLVVVAGAGSGKTTLLVERLLNLCLGHDVRLSQVAAMTFTEKAAAEMRERIATQLSAVLGALRDEGSVDGALRRLRGLGPRMRPAARSLAWIAGREDGGLDVPEDAVRERALAALEDLDGGVVGTIHASCSDLLRRHAREARLDPGFEVDEGEAVRALFDVEWRAFQAEELGAGATRADAWRRVLARARLDHVRDVAWQLARRGRVPGAGSAARGADVVASEARALRAEAPAVRELATNRNLPAHLDAIDRVLAAVEARGLEGRDACQAEIALVAGKAEPSAGAKCPDPDRVDAFLSRAKRLASGLRAIDEEVVGTLLELVAPLVGRVVEAGAREGLVTFDRLLEAARDLLRDHPAVRRAERRNLRAVLLDEFQDTDPIQYEIAFLLADASEEASERDPWAVPLAPGRLFLVGDPKQSIYRFRGADMEAYERALARLTGCGGLRLSLTANFRSRAEVLEPINHLCGRIIREAAPFQPAYEAIEACREDREAGEPRVTLVTVRHDGGRAPERRLAEGRALARLVGEWLAAGTVASAGDVTVLFRAMTDVALYQRALEDADLPFITLGGRSFVDREEVVQLHALLRCLTAPNDAPALLAVLRSPSCGASDAELARFGALVRATPGLAWAFPSARALPADAEAAIPLVARALRGLDSLAGRIARLPADDAMREVLASAGAASFDGSGGGAWRPRLVELNAAAHGGAQRLANLDKLVTWAADLARSEALSLTAVVERLGERLRERKEGESPLADENVDAIKLMSIHQAKGLEFPVVVLPDLGRGLSPDRPEVVEWGDGGPAVRLPGGEINAAAFALARTRRVHDAAERARAVYVAMTRAKERLVLLDASVAVAATDWPLAAVAEHWGYDPADDAASLLGGAVVRRIVTDAPIEPVATQADPLEALAEAVRAGDAACAAIAAAGAGRARSVTGSREDRALRALADERAGEEAGDGPARIVFAPAPGSRGRGGAEIGRAIGVAAHAALEHWDLQGEAGLLDLARRGASIAAAETGSDPGEVEREVVKVLAGFASSEAMARVRSGRVVARELPFLLALEGTPWQGFVDCVLEEAGRTWVVDWKTERELDPAAHRQQLALYGEAVRRWRGLPGPPGLALVHVPTGRWITVAEPA